ncbi:hypothetical protein [Sedimentitalea nanhaiensis]|uniref:Uncharacterized protein n=1 Tax=Sedimentitalea nanhaiensis TaxID=999627 RepID=A0A1I7CF51_9RHOB|nr:hypothetical protein [Sedimentitalea nanhaiensis]SFT98039.1 hypothetical protein SAMN05216236_11654 [Sedimentitalea nanhaiensis]
MYCVNEALQRLEYDLHIHLNHMRRIPVEWEQIYTDRCHHKSRITMRVKQDVLMGGRRDDDGIPRDPLGRPRPA